jgi:hypothetical protein
VLCDRHPARVVRSYSFEGGIHVKHGTTVDEESATKQEADQERLPGKLYWKITESALGGTRHSVSSPGSIRQCDGTGSGWDPFRLTWKAVPGVPYSASVAPRAERSSLLGRITTAVAPPPNLAGRDQADLEYPYRHVDVGLWSYAGPWGSQRWSSGILRVPRVLAGLSLGDSAYHDIGAHHGAVGTEGVRRALRRARERGDEARHGKHAMVAWIAYLFESSSISGDSMEQYVSVVNRAYETSGLSPPGKAPNSTRLYIEVRQALDGFKRARLKAGGAETVQHMPTPDLLIAGM